MAAQPCSKITTSSARPFTEEAPLTPRKKRKWPEMVGDLDSQRIGTQCSDSLVSPKKIQAREDPLNYSTFFLRPKNSGLKEVYDSVKKESEILIKLTDKTRMWLILTQLRIARSVEETNAQNELLAELHRSQQCAFNIRDTVRKYHLTRAKICSKFVKYPHIEEYLIALQELDAQHLFLGKQYLHDIQNVYVVLFALTSKIGILDRTPRSPTY